MALGPQPEERRVWDVHGGDVAVAVAGKQGVQRFAVFVVGFVTHALPHEVAGGDQDDVAGEGVGHAVVGQARRAGAAEDVVLVQVVGAQAGVAGERLGVAGEEIGKLRAGDLAVLKGGFGKGEHEN